MPAISAHPRVILTQMADGTGVLLHLDTKVYYTLNGSGIVVWKRLATQPAPTLSELTALLTKTFEVDEATAAADLSAMLAPLLDEGVIVRV